MSRMSLASRPSSPADPASAFADRMQQLLNHAMLGLMTSIGHQTGLFDALAQLPPSTSAQIASAAGLDERYVREWLAAMVTGRIVDYDGARRTYALPKAHAASLTRQAGSGNFAALTRLLGCLASVESQVIGCFSHGGGVPASAFFELRRIQAEQRALLHERALVDEILPLVDGLPAQLAAGIDILEIDCSAGHALDLIARAYPRCRLRGHDPSVEAIDAARARTDALGLSNTTFTVGDAGQLSDEAAYHLIIAFDALHRQAEPAAVLRVIYRALRPGGIFLLTGVAAASNLADNLEHPLAPALYTLSMMHSVAASREHGGDLEMMAGQERTREMLEEAGFSLTVARLDCDALDSYFIARKR